MEEVYEGHYWLAGSASFLGSLIQKASSPDTTFTGGDLQSYEGALAVRVFMGKYNNNFTQDPPGLFPGTAGRDYSGPSAEGQSLLAGFFPAHNYGYPD